MNAMTSMQLQGQHWTGQEFTIDSAETGGTKSQRLQYHKDSLALVQSCMMANRNLPKAVKDQLPGVINYLTTCWEKLLKTNTINGTPMVNCRTVEDCFAILIDQFSGTADPFSQINLTNCRNALVVAAYIGDIIQQKASAWAKPAYSSNQQITLFSNEDPDDKNSFLDLISLNRNLLWQLYTNSPYIIDLINFGVMSAQKLLKDNPDLITSNDLLVVNLDQLVVRLATYFPVLRGIRINPNSQMLISAPTQLEKSREIAQSLGQTFTDTELQEMNLVDWPHGIFDFTALNSSLFPERQALHLAAFLILKNFLNSQKISQLYQQAFSAALEQQLSMFHSVMQNLKHVVGGQTQKSSHIYDTLEQLNMNLTKLWYNFEVALGKKSYSDRTTFIGWNNRVTKQPEPYALLIDEDSKPSQKLENFIRDNSSKLIAFMQLNPAVQDVINLSISGAILCLKKLGDHYQQGHNEADKQCKNKKIPLKDRSGFITIRAIAKEKLDNINAIIKNMNDLIVKLSAYFPHIKGLTVGKDQSEAKVFENLKKQDDSNTADSSSDHKKKKKKKKKKSKKDAVPSAVPLQEPTLQVVVEAEVVTPAPTAVTEPAHLEPVAQSQPEPESVPAVEEQKSTPAVAHLALERSTSLRTLMTPEERRRMIDERRKSRQLQRTGSGHFTEIPASSSKPQLVRTQSVMFTRVNEVTFAKSKLKKSYKNLCREAPDLIEEVMANPWSTQGLGTPEILSGELKGCVSRRLNDKDRLVYKAERDKDGKVILTIVNTSGHYSAGKS